MTRQETYQAALQKGIADAIEKSVPSLVDSIRSMSTTDAADDHVRELLARIYRVADVASKDIEANIKD